MYMYFFDNLLYIKDTTCCVMFTHKHYTYILTHIHTYIHYQRHFLTKYWYRCCFRWCCCCQVFILDNLANKRINTNQGDLMWFLVILYFTSTSSSIFSLFFWWFFSLRFFLNANSVTLNKWVLPFFIFKCFFVVF